MLRIGAGAGFAGDRIDPAIALVERTTLDYLVFECLAERTIALAQRQSLSAPDLGYDPLLERRMAAVLPAAKAKRTRILTNMGAANPLGAARAVINVAKRLDLAVNVAAVTGDDVLDRLDPNATVMETGQKVSTVANIVSANAYIGAEQLLPALRSDAQVILAGRVADPSLFLAPMIHRFGWKLDDWPRIARGTALGHLLECAGQLTGGYFAEPGRKDIPDLAHLGFTHANHPPADIRLHHPALDVEELRQDLANRALAADAFQFPAIERAHAAKPGVLWAGGPDSEQGDIRLRKSLKDLAKVRISRDGISLSRGTRECGRRQEVRRCLQPESNRLDQPGVDELQDGATSQQRRARAH